MIKYSNTRMDRELVTLLAKNATPVDQTSIIVEDQIWLVFKFLSTEDWLSCTNARGCIVFMLEKETESDLPNIHVNLFYDLRTLNAFWNRNFTDKGSKKNKSELIVFNRTKKLFKPFSECSHTHSSEGQEANNENVFSEWAVNYAMMPFITRGWALVEELKDSLKTAIVIEQIIDNRDTKILMPGIGRPDIEIGVGQGY